MEFAQPILINNPKGIAAESVCAFSTDGKYLAFVDNPKTSATGQVKRSIVRVLDAVTLDDVVAFHTQGRCVRLLWAPTAGSYLLMSVTRRARKLSATSGGQPAQPLGELLELWDVAVKDFYLSLETGPGGASGGVQFAPDSQHVLVTSTCSLQTTVWSLVDGSSCFLESPKSGAKPAFSRAGDRLALLERRDCRDFVCIIGCPGRESSPSSSSHATAAAWQPIVRFPVASPTSACADVAELCWSPNDAVLVVREQTLDFRLTAFDPVTGAVQGSVTLPPEQTGGLGIRCWSFSPTDPIVAVGSYDNEIRIFAAGDHQPPELGLLWSQNHPSSVLTDSFVCYRERPAPTQVGDEFLDRRPLRPTHYELALSAAAGGSDVICRLATAPRPKPNNTEPNCGVRWLEFSPCGRFLASISDSQPHALFVWSIVDAKANGYVLEHLGPVLDAAWGPGRLGDDCRLCCVRDTPSLFLWTPRGAAAVACPVLDPDDQLRAAQLGLPHFRPRSLRWSPGGSSLLMFGSHKLGPNSFIFVDISDDL